MNAGDPNFPNRNLDTGAVTRAAQYKLADETYSQLARHIAHNHFALTTPALKANILEYFAIGPAQHNIKPREWRNTQAALTELKSATGQTLDLGPQTSDLRPRHPAKGVYFARCVYWGSSGRAFWGPCQSRL